MTMAIAIIDIVGSPKVTAQQPNQYKVVAQPVILKKVEVKGLFPAASVSSAAFVKNETPAGAINGSNATFTSAFDFVPESVEVFINGICQRPIVDFNTSGTRTINLSDSPHANESILVNYLKA
jgi:hypothetical protein